MTTEYFRVLKQLADPNDGCVRLPGEKFFLWQPNGQGEHTLLTEHELVLWHDNWIPMPILQQAKDGDLEMSPD